MTATTDARAALQTIVRHMAVDGGPVAAAVATLATIVEQLLPPEVPAVQCPACKRMVTPHEDGTLPGHDIGPGPRRSPRCRYRGRAADQASLILDRALPGRGSD